MSHPWNATSSAHGLRTGSLRPTSPRFKPRSVYDPLPSVLGRAEWLKRATETHVAAIDRVCPAPAPWMDFLTSAQVELLPAKPSDSAFPSAARVRQESLVTGVQTTVVLLLGDEVALDAQCGGWVELLVAELLHVYPSLSAPADLASLAQLCLKRKGSGGLELVRHSLSPPPSVAAPRSTSVFTVSWNPKLNAPCVAGGAAGGDDAGGVRRRAAAADEPVVAAPGQLVRRACDGPHDHGGPSRRAPAQPPAAGPGREPAGERTEA